MYIIFSDTSLRGLEYLSLHHGGNSLFILACDNVGKEIVVNYILFFVKLYYKRGEGRKKNGSSGNIQLSYF